MTAGLAQAAGQERSAQVPLRDAGASSHLAARPANPQRDPVVLTRVLRGLERLPDTPPPAAGGTRC